MYSHASASGFLITSQTHRGIARCTSLITNSIARQFCDLASDPASDSVSWTGVMSYNSLAPGLYGKYRQSSVVTCAATLKRTSLIQFYF